MPPITVPISAPIRPSRRLQSKPGSRTRRHFFGGARSNARPTSNLIKRKQRFSRRPDGTIGFTFKRTPPGFATLPVVNTMPPPPGFEHLTARTILKPQTVPVVSSTPNFPEPLNDSLSLTIAASPLVAPSSIAAPNHPGAICLTPEAAEVPTPRAESSQAEAVTIQQSTIEPVVEHPAEPGAQTSVQPDKSIMVKTKAISRVVIKPVQCLVEPSKPNTRSHVQSEVQSTAFSTWAILLSLVGVLLIGVLGNIGDGMNVLMVGGVLCMSGIFFVHSLLAGKVSTDDGNDLEAKRRKKRAPKRCKSRRSVFHAATDTLQSSPRMNVDVL